MNDICENKHQQNAESVAANPGKESKQRDRFRVYKIVLDKSGITSKEIAAIMKRPLNCISGRITELKKNGRIMAIGRENGCAKLYASTKVRRNISRTAYQHIKISNA
tara:strand:+ start:124 stop:444 length:321 start_codon:yes stop_codon:yes gene_type:complete